MNVTNFKVKFNHFVISKAFHSSSGISLVGKRKGDYLCFPVFWDKFVGLVLCTHSFKLDDETEVGQMLMKVFPMHVLIYMHVVVHSTWRISKLSFGSPTPNHIKYCTTLDTNSETYLCTILLCAFFIIIFVYTSVQYSVYWNFHCALSMHRALYRRNIHTFWYIISQNTST